MRRDRKQGQLGMTSPGPNYAAMGIAPHMPGGFGLPTEGDVRGDSLWTVIDDRMRGRWHWAILLGILLSATLGLLGFKSAKPMYQSVGAIRISPQTPIVLSPAPEHRKDHYPQFVATQIRLMTTARVLEQALRDPALAALPLAQKPNAAKKLKEGLLIGHQRDSHIVEIAFEHEDPKVAQIALNAIIKAYMEIHGQYGGNDLSGTLTTLHDRKAAFEREMQSIAADRRKIIEKYKISNLHDLQSSVYSQIASLESQISVGKLSLERLEMRSAASENEQVAQESLPRLDQLAAINPQLPDLKRLRDEARNRFLAVEQRFLPGTASYESARRDAENAERVYQQALNEAFEQWSVLGPDTVLTQGTAYQGLTIDEVRAEVGRLEARLADLKRMQAQLTDDVQTWEQLAYREDQVLHELERINSRIDSIEVEKDSLSSFITVEQEGLFNDEPAEDARRKRAILGAGLGLVGSFGLFFMLGTLDRRAFGASQLHGLVGSRIPACLGVLPDLGASFSDPESSDVASHCVHQIRNQIEAMREPHEGYVLAVSSPFQGDGKTSIVMALGWSYAAAGYNTLVIDCDMVGRSLTRQLGLIGREGLKEALMARELNGSINRLPVEHLSAIPVGVDPRFGPENIRRSDLDALLDQVRGQYDIILIDTGPLLGSLESTPVSAVADGVVLSVRRGRSRTRLEDCVSRLQLVGTPCVGVILNCAVRSDCNRYVSEASLAAAEENRMGRQDGDGKAIVTVTPGERNALMRAMQNASRPRT